MPYRGQREIDMSRDRWVGICTQFKGRLRQRWGWLSSDPLSIAAGAHERLVGRIQEQRGIAKEASARELKEFLARNRNWRDLSPR